MTESPDQRILPGMNTLWNLIHRVELREQLSREELRLLRLLARRWRRLFRSVHNMEALSCLDRRLRRLNI
jgi:hypothetical protein